MKIQAYTSCALNYLPKARVLAKSLASICPKIRLTLLLADPLPEWLSPATEPFDAIWSPEDLGFDQAWAFKHNVMELCTAVKGRGLCRLLSDIGTDLVLYLDPDCVVYNDLAVVNEYLGEDSIGLIPHILSPEDTELGIRLTEMSVLEHGTYNLGHLIVRNDRHGNAFARWWADRLDRYCYDDKERGLFTDQRWIDLVPALFNGVRILKQPNLNVASWNIARRQIAQKRAGDLSSIQVDGHPLLTYHFSGTGPSGTHRRVREIFAPSNGTVAEIERDYEARIAASGQTELERFPFIGDTFADGSPITSEARKLYRQHLDLQAAFPDPFTSGLGKHTYQNWLRENRPTVLGGLSLNPRRLQQSFDALFDEDYYLSAYPEVSRDVAKGKFVSALDHYIEEGSQLLYNTNELFVASYYYENARGLEPHGLRAQPRTKRTTLLWHYLTVGLPNGIEPLPFFDSVKYLKINSDVKAAYEAGVVACPLAHYLISGAQEDRDPGLQFSPRRYLQSNPAASALVESGRARGAIGAYLCITGFTEPRPDNPKHAAATANGAAS